MKCELNHPPAMRPCYYKTEKGNKDMLPYISDKCDKCERNAGSVYNRYKTDKCEREREKIIL